MIYPSALSKFTDIPQGLLGDPRVSLRQLREMYKISWRKMQNISYVQEAPQPQIDTRVWGRALPQLSAAGMLVIATPPAVLERMFDMVCEQIFTPVGGTMSAPICVSLIACPIGLVIQAHSTIFEHPTVYPVGVYDINIKFAEFAEDVAHTFDALPSALTAHIPRIATPTAQWAADDVETIMQVVAIKVIEQAFLDLEGAPIGTADSVSAVLFFRDGAVRVWAEVAQVDVRVLRHRFMRWYNENSQYCFSHFPL